MKVYIVKEQDFNCYVCEGGGPIKGIFANQHDANEYKKELDVNDTSRTHEVVEKEVIMSYLKEAE